MLAAAVAASAAVAVGGAAAASEAQLLELQQRLAATEARCSHLELDLAGAHAVSEEATALIGAQEAQLLDLQQQVQDAQEKCLAAEQQLAALQQQQEQQQQGEAAAAAVVGDSSSVDPAVVEQLQAQLAEAQQQLAHQQQQLQAAQQQPQQQHVASVDPHAPEAVLQLQQQLAAAHQQLGQFGDQLQEAALAVGSSREAAAREAARAEAAEAAVLQLRQQAGQMEQHYVGQLQALQQQYEALQASHAAVSAAGGGVAVSAAASLASSPDRHKGAAANAEYEDGDAAAGGLSGEAAAEGGVGVAMEPLEAAAGEASPAGGSGAQQQQWQQGGVVRRERGAMAAAGSGSVALDIELGVDDAAGGSSPSPRAGATARGGGLVGQVLNRVTRVGSTVAAALRAAEGRSLDGSGAYDDSDDEEGEAGWTLLHRQQLQLGTLRPFAAIPAVRKAHPQLVGVLSRIDGAWARVTRLVSSSPLSRVGLLGYLLLLHVLVLWVHMSCQAHYAAAAAVPGVLGPAAAAAATHPAAVAAAAGQPAAVAPTLGVQAASGGGAAVGPTLTAAAGGGGGGVVGV